MTVRTALVAINESGQCFDMFFLIYSVLFVNQHFIETSYRVSLPLGIDLLELRLLLRVVSLYIRQPSQEARWAE